MKKRMFLGLTAFAALSLFAAACGGDDGGDATGDDGDAASKTAEKSAEGNGSATAASGDKTATGEATKASGGGEVTGSGAAELKALSKDLKNKTYSVTYETEITDKGKKPTTGTMATAQKSGKTYTKIETTEGLSNVIFIDDGTNSYLCSDAEGEKSCLKSKSTGNTGSAALSATDLVEGLDEDVKVDKDKDQKIAGVDSKCFKFKDSTGEGTACFAKDSGIMTFSEGIDEEGTLLKLKATKVSTNVPDSTFEAPEGYEVIDFG